MQSPLSFGTCLISPTLLPFLAALNYIGSQHQPMLFAFGCLCSNCFLSLESPIYRLCILNLPSRANPHIVFSP